MKDFFKKLIDQLPMLIGVDMYTLYEPDQLEMLVDELVKAGNQIPYNQIPEEVKQRIVMDQITRDEALVNVRFGQKPGLHRMIVQKWYQKHWELFGERISQKNAFSENEQKAEPASPEKVDFYCNQIKAQLVGNHFKPEFKNLDNDMKQIQREDQERQSGKKSQGYKPNEEYYQLIHKKMEAARSRGLDKVNFNEIKTFVIEGEKILARDEDEAREIYLEVYE